MIEQNKEINMQIVDIDAETTIIISSSGNKIVLRTNTCSVNACLSVEQTKELIEKLQKEMKSKEK